MMHLPLDVADGKNRMLTKDEKTALLTKAGIKA